jgi:hypothetical protein
MGTVGKRVLSKRVVIRELVRGDRDIEGEIEKGRGRETLRVGKRGKGSN